MKANASHRLTALLLALLAAAPSFSACGADTPAGTSADVQPEDTTPVTTSRWLDSLPEELDFGGKEIVINVRGDANAMMEVAVDGENGDVLNDAIYYRNRDVEERLNVKITRFDGAGYANYNSELARIRSSVAAGDNAWQLIAGWGSNTSFLVLENLFQPLDTLDYLNLDAPWWTQSIVEAKAVGGHNYLITGDISFLTTIGGSYVLYQNDRLAKEYQIEDVPALVKSGSWTIDRLKSITKGVMKDLDGNGVWDEKDQYGIVMSLYNPADAFYISSGLTHIGVKDGEPFFDLDLDRTSAVMEKLWPLFFEGETVGAFCKEDLANTIRPMFLNGQGLFLTLEFDSSRGSLRNMKDDFTILPYPKFDEKQEEYRVPANNSAAMWGIPVDNPEPEVAAAVLEALCAESRHSVTDVYFDTCMNFKYARNDVSIEMLEIIRDSAYINVEGLYSKVFGEPLYSFRRIFDSGNPNVSSYYESKRAAYEASIANVVASLKEMN